MRAFRQYIFLEIYEIDFIVINCLIKVPNIKYIYTNPYTFTKKKGYVIVLSFPILLQIMPYTTV